MSPIKSIVASMASIASIAIIAGILVGAAPPKKTAFYFTVPAACTKSGKPSQKYSKISVQWRKNKKTKLEISNWKKFFSASQSVDSQACHRSALRMLRKQLKQFCAKGRLELKDCKASTIEKELLGIKRFATHHYLALNTTVVPAPTKVIQPLVSQPVSLTVTKPPITSIPNTFNQVTDVQKLLVPPPSVPVAKNQNCFNCNESLMLQNEKLTASPLQGTKYLKEKSCVQLNKGDSVFIDWNTLQSPNGHPVKYRLTKIDDKNFEIGLQLKFLNQSEEFTKRTLQCFKQVNPNLIGPQGEKIKMVMLDPQDTSLPSSPWEIKVQDIERSEVHTTSTFRVDAPCSTLLHEYFHMMGLLDEYKETKIGYVINLQTNAIRQVSKKPAELNNEVFHTAYNCRAVGPNDSMMALHSDAFAAVFGGRSMTLCRCVMGRLCASSMKTWNQSYCPPNTDRIELNTTEEGLEPLTEYYSDQKIKITRRVFNPTRSSLLHPAHFNVLTQPGCELNQDYYECSKNAYQTSQDHGGSGCRSYPSSCANGSTEWLGKPQ